MEKVSSILRCTGAFDGSRPADLLSPQLQTIEKEMGKWKEQDEDVLTYALFPQVAEDFFAYRQAQKTAHFTV